MIPKTASPVAAIAEQITLVYINDLYRTLFIRLVEATVKTGTYSVKSLSSNLQACNLGNSLKPFEKEMRSVIEGVPRGSAAHALGLVLLGLWGILCGTSAATQSALTSALAAEEVKGGGSALASVPAMLELLYPGTPSQMSTKRMEMVLALPANALAVDRLALACIEYIRLLSNSKTLNSNGNRLQRLEASQSVQKATSHLRLVLTQTSFVGLSEDEGELMKKETRNFEIAKEDLVGVLSVIGRRAAGRVRGRDEDSGLEGDWDDL